MKKRKLITDWTAPEKRNPIKNDVVRDIEGNLGLVVYTYGELGKRLIDVENVQGKKVYEKENPLLFSIVKDKDRNLFYKLYYSYKGWKIGRVYTLKGKDYPLLLTALDFSIKNQKAVFIFRDLNVSEKKLFKTVETEALEQIDESIYEMLETAFEETTFTSLGFEVKIEKREISSGAWNVNGKETLFGEKQQVKLEIERWLNRMKIRRICSILSEMNEIEETVFCMNESGNIYLTPLKKYYGQPAIFKSRIAAALCLSIVSEEFIKNVLLSDYDTYFLI